MREDNNTIEEQEGNLENSPNGEGQTENEVEDFELELSDIEKKDIEIQALNDKYIRLYSEFDNFRRRTQKEKLELYKTAGEDVFKSLLPVMDDFERAKKSMEETKDYDSLKLGVDLIFNKLLSVFKANGVEPMDSEGKEFDSEIHEAITQIPAPSKKLVGKIVDVLEKGYILNEKVIRYAKVVVGK